MNGYLCILIVALLFIVTVTAFEPLYDAKGYPIHIPAFRVRRDMYSGSTVSRGKIQLLADFRKKIELEKRFTKIPLQEFRKRLQCAPHQPVFEQKITHLLPPTYEIGTHNSPRVLNVLQSLNNFLCSGTCCCIY